MNAQRRAFSVAVYARHAGKVLLIKHKRLGTWLPVGGEMEAGETPLEAAARELREETGLVGRFEADPLIDGTPRGLLGYEEHIAGSKGLHMNFAFVAEVDTDRVTPNEEFSEFRWVSSFDGIECPLNARELGLAALAANPVAPWTIAKKWLAAFNARDLDALLALYAADAVHTSPKLKVRDPKTGGKVRGQAALRAWWADSYARLPGLRYEEQHLTAAADRVFMEYLRVNPGEESYVVAEVLVVRGGKIVESAVFHG